MLHDELDLSADGLKTRQVFRNLAPAVLYEHGVQCGDEGGTASGALATSSGEKTGR